jgi:glycine oxidase
VRHEPDVAVIGAGIAGLSAALALAEAGFRVTVLDEPRAGAASRTSAGMLAAGFGFPAAVAAHAIAARECYPSFVERLVEGSGIRVPLDRRGIIELPASAEELEGLHASAPVTAERLRAVDLAALDPLLAGHEGGLLHPHDGAVDPVVLMDALVRCAQRDARIALVEHGVASVDLAPARPRVGLSDGAWLTVDRLVVASGAWAGQLAGLPRPLPVRPVRGELLLLDSELPRHVVHADRGYLIPRSTGLLVGATSVEGGFDVRTTQNGRADLLAIAARIAPAATMTVADHWAGLRPMTPDNLPILGVDPGVPALVYAAGFSRNGILFAPWAARGLAALVGGAAVPALQPFAVDRFR